MDEVTSVLIVDDNEAIREYLQTVIENMGYSAFTAADGIEAMNFLHDNPKPDLILLDVIMPGMNGIDVLRQIKEDAKLKGITIIMVTGVHHITEKELAFTLGASDFIEKPFESRELIARVRTHINLKKATEKCFLQKKVQDTILSTIPGIVYMKGKNGTYIHGNEMFADLVGQSIMDISGKTENDLFAKEIADQRIKTDDLILNLGIPEIEMQEEISTRNGENRFFFTKKRPVFTENHEITGLVGVSIDITEQVILKEAYYEKEELLNAILNSYPAEIWVINPEGEMILQNNVHLEKYGNLIGKKIEEMPISDETRKIWLKGLACALQGQDKMENMRFIKPDGTEWIMNAFSPVRLDEGILGAMGINLDITKWKPSDVDIDSSGAISNTPHQENTKKSQPIKLTPKTDGSDG